MVLPRATRCLWPPDNAFGLRDNNSEISKISAAALTLLSISSFGVCLSFKPKAIFSYTVICGYRA